jgi:NTP-dependent ternary system trypsin peptidase co-occuring protein
LSEFVRFETTSGSIVVEVADGDPGLELVGRDGVIADARQKLDSALRDVRDAAEGALKVFRDGRLRPDGIEVEFGVKLSAEAGAVLAKSALEGHFTVKLTWTGELARSAVDGDQAADER